MTDGFLCFQYFTQTQAMFRLALGTELKPDVYSVAITTIATYTTGHRRAYRHCIPSYSCIVLLSDKCVDSFRLHWKAYAVIRHCSMRVSDEIIEAISRKAGLIQSVMITMIFTNTREHVQRDLHLARTTSHHDLHALAKCVRATCVRTVSVFNTHPVQRHCLATP
jgi:hypothetical protein